MDLSGGTLTATSGVTNNGGIRLARGASLAVSGGAFVNSGVLDVITGSFTPPTGGFVNNGVVLDSSAVRAQSASYQPSSQTFTVQIDGYPGHIYRLQKSATLISGFASAGVPDQPVAGNSGASAPTLTFTDNYQSAAQGFYRVVVDP